TSVIVSTSWVRLAALMAEINSGTFAGVKLAGTVRSSSGSRCSRAPGRRGRGRCGRLNVRSQLVQRSCQLMVGLPPGRVCTRRTPFSLRARRPNARELTGRCGPARRVAGRGGQFLAGRLATFSLLASPSLPDASLRGRESGKVESEPPLRGE